MNRKDYRKQYVWDGVRKPKFPAKRIVCWQDEVSCCAVKREDEEAFLSGGVFRTDFWDHYELIPKERENESREIAFNRFLNLYNNPWTQADYPVWEAACEWLRGK